ncbi:MAG: GTP 3',8-cyclase MoaA [Deltaproteobacteria bacterium]|nr:GTP 3',8-cyclase MoaA [Deltaproteobacteria bacterium]
MGATAVEGARRVDRLRLSVTDRCDLRCTYCMPACGIAKVARRRVLTIEEMAHLASLMVSRFGIRAIRLTGGEPLIREGVERLVSLLSGMGLEDLALTTNAQRLAGVARELKARGLMRVNVSLDTLDPHRFSTLTGGGDMAPTLAGIEAALVAGLGPVKLNAVVLGGVNDDEIERIARYGLERGCEVRFLELMPIGVARRPHASLFVPAVRILDRLAASFRLEALDAPYGSTARLWSADDGAGLRGRIGVISPETVPFCSQCGRLRLTTEGRLLGCLHEEGGVDLRDGLRAPTGPDDEAVVSAIARAIESKPACRSGSRRSPMHIVGG